MATWQPDPSFYPSPRLARPGKSCGRRVTGASPLTAAKAVGRPGPKPVQVYRVQSW